MRIGFFIILLVINNLCFAQTVEKIVVTEKVEGKVADILAGWADKYELKIAFNHSLLSGYEIEENFNGISLDSALQIIISKTDLKLIRLGDKFIITQKTPHSESPSNYNFAIQGKIIDQETGEALPYAHIKIEGLNKGTSSDHDGFFSIVNVPNDTCFIGVYYLGYRPLIIKSSDFLESSEPFSVHMQPQADYLESVLVEGYLLEKWISENKVSQSVLSPRIIEQLPSLGEADIFKTIQMLPGISASNESSAGLNIRGSLPGQNLVLLDGFTVYHLDHFFGVFSAINPDILKSVKVFKGGYGAEYGGRVGGVVDIIGKSGNSQEVAGKVSLNLITAKATLEVPLSKKLTFVGSARRSYNDVIESPLYTKLLNVSRENDFQNLGGNRELFREEMPDFYYYDLNGKLTFTPSSKDVIALSYYRSKDFLNNEFDDTVEDGFFDFSFTSSEENSWGNDGVNWRWARQWSSGFSTKLQYSYASYFNNYDLQESFSETPTVGGEESITGFSFYQGNSVGDHSIQLDNQFVLSDNWQLDAGLSIMNYNLFFEQGTFVSDEPEEAEEERTDGWVSTLSVRSAFSAFQKLDISVGARISKNDWESTTYFEPRTQFNYPLSGKWKLKAALSRHYQFIKQIEYVDPYSGDLTFWALSKEDGVTATRANHYIAGFTYEAEKLLIDVEWYHKKLNGINQIFPITFNDFIGFQEDVLLSGEENVRGLDFLLQKQVGNYTGWLAYTLSEVRQRFEGINGDRFFPALQDQRHEFKMAHFYQTKSFDFSIVGVFATGRPYIYYNINFEEEDVGDGTPPVLIPVLNRDFTNSRRIGAYKRIDLSAAYKLKFEKSRGKAGISFINILNTRNIRSRRVDSAALQFEPSFGNTNQYYKDLVLLGFTPSLFVSLEF